MAITINQIKTLAKLSRLEFDDQKCAEFAPQFDEIIGFANTINDMVEGDTSTIKEVDSLTIDWQNLREDEVAPSLANEKILSNVQGEGGYFTVKRVVK